MLNHSLKFIIFSLVIVFVLVTLFSCKCYEPCIDGIVIRTDTVTVCDTVQVPVHIPGDTVYVHGDTIESSKENAENLLNNRFTVKPWMAMTKYSWAIAGITSNVPYLYLYNFPRDFVISHPFKYNYYNTTTTNTITKTEIKEVDKKYYKNIWFYISVIQSLIVARLLKIDNLIVSLIKRFISFITNIINK